eukprot:TRINITY_DN21516_c0_g1_i1.p1 TRINITY_DN21516_c0_g1~~TRINITY_DN21516_c0_g1_i1.p1  ORF type:complete len:526 (+),score=117.60 TRINITY_DN21516_c0_g1_i1:46-1578(+)
MAKKVRRVVRRVVKRKRRVLSKGEEAVDIFFDAQDALEAGEVEEAKEKFIECMDMLPEGCTYGEVSGTVPPREILISSVLNSLGEIHMDEALAEAGQEKLTSSSSASAKEYFERATKTFSSCYNGWLSLAGMCRDANDVQAAMVCYLHATRTPPATITSQPWAETWVLGMYNTCRPIALYHLALLYSQLGVKSTERSDILQLFGVRYALSPAVWSHTRSKPPTGHPSSSPPVALYQDMIPPALLSRLTKAFSPSSPYWAETGYSARGYFSFFYSPTVPPCNVVEQLIQLAIKNSGIREQVRATEWWAHTRLVGRDIGHQMHFDMEEKTLEATGEIIHPLKSVVVYLTGAETGGVTVVVDQKVEDTEKVAGKTGGWAAHPKDGAVLYFPGNRLHGVLPACSTLDTPVQRLTLLIALWGTNKFSKPKGELGPQTALPTDTKWAAALKPPLKKKSLPSTQPVSLPVAPIGAVWDAVPSAEGDGPYPLPESINQRFFVRDLDFKKMLLVDHGLQ